MAVRDRIARSDLAKAARGAAARGVQLATDRLNKALTLPAGSTTYDEATNRAIAMQRIPDGSFTPLARTEPLVPFGPGIPLVPAAIDPTGGQARPDPRRYEYPVAANLPGSNQPAVPFNLLRQAADHIDVVRRCIEVRKAQIQALEWDIIISPHATARVMQEAGITEPGKASQLVYEKLGDDIQKARDFWRMPDRLNGDTFVDWIGKVLEEHFVTDALSIVPRFTFGGDLNLTVIDGATIKPLLDHLGNTPAPPQPAFQQILYGFPRGEFVASTDPDGEYTADDLIYRPRLRRSHSPYGFSNVEQALSTADIYLKTSEWLRTEFSDGSTPSTFMKTDIQVSNAPGMAGQMSPGQLLEYERILNDELAGQTQQRKRIRLLAKGMEPDQMVGFTEKFNSDIYEYVIKLLCMAFDVMPTEIGFSPKGGIGGKGHSEGEENTTYRKAIRPTVVWLQNICSFISWRYLGLPLDLAFSFMGYEVEDQLEVAQEDELLLRNGIITSNEARSKRGLPMYNFKEADTPFVQTGAGVQFLEGALDASPPSETIDSSTQQPGAAHPSQQPPPGTQNQPPKPPQPPAPAPGVAKEAAAFVRYATRRAGKTWRDFEFDHVDPHEAHLLNTFGAVGDLEAIKTTVADLGKAPAPRRGGRFAQHGLVAKHAAAVHSALRDAFPPAAVLAHAWMTTKGVDPDQRARARALVDAHTSDHHPVASALHPVYVDGYRHGANTAAQLVGDDESDLGDPTDLDAVDKVALGLIGGMAGALALQLALNQNTDDLESRLADTLDDSDNTDLTVDYMAGIGGQQGAQDEYGARGVTYELELDDGACDLCDSFDGSNARPPFHPNCGCALVPAE